MNQSAALFCKPWQAVLLGTLLTASAARGAEDDLLSCRFPQPPVIPDGADAKDAEMKDAGSAVRTFIAAMQDSLACLDRVDADHGDDARTHAQVNLLYNNGVDQMHTVADAYNDQVARMKLQSCGGVERSDHCMGVVPGTNSSMFRGSLNN